MAMRRRKAKLPILQATIRQEQKGGFDCEFVEHPQEKFQANCPICLLVLREPHQVTCCGNSFCRTCIERVQLLQTPCPTCTHETFSVFPNKGLQRSLYSFVIQCSHEKEGCQWTGELGELVKHLNENPRQQEPLVGCEFVEIECCYCCERFKRRCITTHETEECNRRPFSCDYCGTYKADFKDVITNHWPVCKYRPVPCPNECGGYPKYQSLEQHMNEDCPCVVINCDLHFAGCEVQLPRNEFPSHHTESAVTHISLMARYLLQKSESDAQNSKSEVKEETKKEVVELRNELKALEQQCQKNRAELADQQKQFTKFLWIFIVALLVFFLTIIIVLALRGKKSS